MKHACVCEACLSVSAYQRFFSQFATIRVLPVALMFGIRVDLPAIHPHWRATGSCAFVVRIRI
eukprot:6888969-Pyramimonas_sp.AAC.1